MVSALDSGCGRCVVFLCKSLYSHSAFLRSGVKMVTGELSRMPDEILDISITFIDGGGRGGGSHWARVQIFYSYFTLVSRSLFVRKMHRSTKF